MRTGGQVQFLAMRQHPPSVVYVRSTRRDTVKALVAWMPMELQERSVFFTRKAINEVAIEVPICEDIAIAPDEEHTVGVGHWQQLAAMGSGPAQSPILPRQRIFFQRRECRNVRQNFRFAFVLPKYTLVHFSYRSS